MASRRTVSVERTHMSKTLTDICEFNRIRHELEKIPVGEVMFIPSALSDVDDGRKRKSPKSMFRVKFKVVGKNRNMLVCERGNGTKECFTYGDLVMIEKKYGGLINGKSE